MCGRIGAHVTLVHDVIDHERASDLVAAVAAETPPFRMRLTHADRWGPSAYGIYLHVDDPTGTVPAMQSRLAGLEHPSWARVPFRAHCTLVHGRTVDPALAEEAWSALASFEAGLELELSSVDIIELEEPAWRTVERFELCAAPVAD